MQCDRLMLMVCLSFVTLSRFFTCDYSHLNIHSFPTRRSSDLMYDAWAAYDDQAVGTRLGGSLRRPPVERDRKSTRLNYSHPSISYAVFCLKKKTLLFSV